MTTQPDTNEETGTMTGTQGGEPVADRTWAGMSAAHYKRQVGRLATHLRDLAERVEHEGVARPGLVGERDGKPEYVYAASQVVDAVVWGLANAGLSGLISAASEADRAARTPHVQS